MSRDGRPNLSTLETNHRNPVPDGGRVDGELTGWCLRVVLGPPSSFEECQTPQPRPLSKHHHFDAKSFDPWSFRQPVPRSDGLGPPVARRHGGESLLEPRGTFGTSREARSRVMEENKSGRSLPFLTSMIASDHSHRRLLSFVLTVPLVHIQLRDVCEKRPSDSKKKRIFDARDTMK
jgi:hypothetical protein